MKQYPADFRDRLLRALDAGLARAEATRTFGVPDRTIRRWQRQRRETGSVAPQRRVGRRRLIEPAAEGALRVQVAAHADATLAEAHRCAVQFTGKVVALVGVTLAAGVVTWIWSPIKFQADMGILLTFMFVWNMVGALILIPALSHFLLKDAECAKRFGAVRELRLAA